MTVTLTRVSAYEAAQVAEIINTAYTGVNVSTSDTAEVIGERTRNTEVMVAKVASELIGTVTIARGSGRGELAVHRLAVHPAHQGRGYGRHIVAALADTARRHGLTALAGHSMDSMTTAHSLYESLGATRDPLQDIALPDGRTAYYYRLNL